MNRSADQLYRVALDEFRRRGVRRLFVKHLARNDNDKNQIYISPDLDGIGNLLRGRLSDGSESTSVAKPQSSPGLAKMEVHLDWAWIGSDGDAVAPNTKLIYYFQYPEVRLSGFLSGCTDPPDALRRRRLDLYGARVLFFGSTGNRVFGRVIAGPPGTTFREIPGSYPSPVAQSLLEVQLGAATPQLSSRPRTPGMDRESDPGSATEERIRGLIGPWHPCVRLKDASQGPVPFSGPQRAGYTLEALLGVASNASSGPDLDGSELKTFRFSRKVTLMTPVADGGREKVLGMRKFLERYGREGRDGESMRFTGTYLVGSVTQGRTLVLEKAGSHVLETTGAALVESDPLTVLSRWSRDHLSSHWLAKHDSTFYVDYELHPTENQIRFCGYFRCEGTSPERLFRAIAAGTVYYDPAHTLKNGQLKTRPQWRISTARRTLTDSLNSLYRSVERVDG